MDFQPDYRHFQDVMNNRRPGRLPLYEHIISPQFMEAVLGTEFACLGQGNSTELLEFFRHYCAFFQQMTYDVVSFELCITDILPGHGALSSGKPGPIQTRADFNAYPWDELVYRFMQDAKPKFDALAQSLPKGMKAVGGIGNGVFEISEDLVGLAYLPFMQKDDPELYADLFQRIGDTMCAIWSGFIQRYQEAFVTCRFGDDLGFKSSLLTNPRTVQENIIPQYQRVIKIIHGAHMPFLLHSCGCIFDIMPDLIALGINAKHSNEDTIAPFDRWISDYGRQIGLLGGFDMDFLCTRDAEEVFRTVLSAGQRFRASAQGYALGSGNSIPDYVPVENYLAMIRAAQAIRQAEL